MGGMTGSLLLLLWAGVSVSTMVDLQKRIINGQNCNDNERQYHVHLLTHLRTGETGHCGGSLISDQWILTAAHCWNVTHGTAITAELGVHPGRRAETIAVDRIEIYQDQDNNGNVRTHDIMLLRLTTPKPGFKQIQLPYCDRHPTPRNEMVQIAGHGAITAAPDKTRTPYLVPDLKCANIKVNDCPGVQPNQYDTLFCGETTDINNPVDSCLGDSGGGVVYNGKIYGVISRGDKKACTGPDKYVGVCGYMNWIRNTMNPPTLTNRLG